MTELTNVSQFWAGIQKSKNMMIPMICPSFDNMTVTLSLRKTCKALAYNERLFLRKMCIVQFIIQQYTAVVYHFNFDQAGNFTHQQKRLAKLTLGMLLEINLSYDPVCLLVRPSLGWLVGQSVTIS